MAAGYGTRFAEHAFAPDHVGQKGQADGNHVAKDQLVQLAANRGVTQLGTFQP